jgi:hypothetical protein
MAKLIYTAITSLDGYVADANGNFDWAAPDDDVHAFVNELERPIGTYLDGRRLYEVNPIVVGGGNAALPDDVRIQLELIDLHRFENGVVFVRYVVAGR